MHERSKQDDRAAPGLLGATRGVPLPARAAAFPFKLDKAAVEFRTGANDDALPIDRMDELRAAAPGANLAGGLVLG